MFIGFLRADVDPSAPATLIAVLIAIGLPAAGGAWLLATHFGLGRGLAERKERLTRETLEAEILRMAGRHDGKLTVVEVVAELAVPDKTAKQALDALMTRELAEIEITDSGVLVYAFHDIEHLSEKPRARGLLDD
jgi:hypothetical protein